MELCWFWPAIFYLDSFRNRRFVVLSEIPCLFNCVLYSQRGRYHLAKPRKKGKQFEEKLAELEQIVARLEEGDSTLEESLDLFQRGTEYLKELADMLDAAEKQVEVLIKDSSGNVSSEPLKEEVSEE